MTEVPLDYLKAHVPDEYARRMALIQGVNSAKARSIAKKRMLERLGKQKKMEERLDLN